MGMPKCQLELPLFCDFIVSLIGNTFMGSKTIGNWNKAFLFTLSINECHNQASSCIDNVCCFIEGSMNGRIDTHDTLQWVPYVDMHACMDERIFTCT